MNTRIVEVLPVYYILPPSFCMFSESLISQREITVTSYDCVHVYRVKYVCLANRSLVNLVCDLFGGIT